MAIMVIQQTDPAVSAFEGVIEGHAHAAAADDNNLNVQRF